jgi:hypothetical protein
MQLANVNIHFLSRTARAAWNGLRVRRYAPISHRQAAQPPAGARFFTTPIEQDWVTARNPEPIPTACPC